MSVTAPMFITLSHVQNDEPIPLNPVLDNRAGGMEVALSEILYYPAWFNIAEPLGDNIFHYGPRENEIQIPDGYWDICGLNKEIFAPLDLKLSMNPATGRVSISGIEYYLDLGSVGNTLGFVNLAPPVMNGRVVAEKFPRLIVYKDLYVHLSGAVHT